MFSSTVYVYSTVNSDCWSETSDVHGFGGISHDLPTLARCQAACINDRSCVAIDWEPSNIGKSCWVLTFIFTKPTLDTGVIIHYKLNRTCAGEFCSEFSFTQFAFRLRICCAFKSGI